MDVPGAGSGVRCHGLLDLLQQHSSLPYGSAPGSEEHRCESQGMRSKADAQYVRHGVVSHRVQVHHELQGHMLQLHGREAAVLEIHAQTAGQQVIAVRSRFLFRATSSSVTSPEESNLAIERGARIDA